MVDQNKTIADKFAGTRQAPKKENKLHSDPEIPENEILKKVFGDEQEVKSVKKVKKESKEYKDGTRVPKTYSLYKPQMDAVDEAMKIFQGMTFKKVTESSTLIALFMYGYEALKSEDPKVLKKIKMLLLEHM